MGTRVTLTTTVRLYIDENDSGNSHFTDAQIYTSINKAIRYLGTDLEWPIQTAQATAVTDQAVYTLPDDFISLLDVYFDNSPLILIERADLPAINGTWQDATSTIPRYAYKADNAKIGVYPKPDSSQSGNLLQIQYIKIPPDLSDDSTAPDLHTVFQDCLPYYAASELELSMGNTKRSQDLRALFEAEKKRLQSKVQRFSDEMRFTWSKPRSYR